MTPPIQDPFSVFIPHRLKADEDHVRQNGHSLLPLPPRMAKPGAGGRRKKKPPGPLSSLLVVLSWIARCDRLFPCTCPQKPIATVTEKKEDAIWLSRVVWFLLLLCCFVALLLLQASGVMVAHTPPPPSFLQTPALFSWYFGPGFPR